MIKIKEELEESPIGKYCQGSFPTYTSVLSCYINLQNGYILTNRQNEYKDHIY